MARAIAINGSPRKEKGNTAIVLGAFLEGLAENGIDVELHYASRLKIQPCACGEMRCWYASPGECCIKDDMQLIYPKLKEAEIVILATPVYIPLPGAMQNFINRLCPLVVPRLEFRQGRTRARLREDVKIQKFVLVSTGGWWEKENMSTVVRIVEELAENAGVEFGGAILRPHAFLMNTGEKINEEGKQILIAVKRAGNELVRDGRMNPETLDSISRPLITEEELINRYNQIV